MGAGRRRALPARRPGAAVVSVEELEPRVVLDAAPTTPVLFLPGFAASTPRASDLASFVFSRGGSPTTLKLATVYQPLVDALEASGYVQGRTFFGATFDWRMPVAPTDGNNDGNLANLTADQLTSGVRTGRFPYAVDYLGYWLDQAVQANVRAGLAPPSQVDVVTHSTGGFLARSYIESPAYGRTYTDEEGVTRTLPTIRNLVLGADPVEGTVHSWRPWSGDFQDVLSGFIPTTEVSARLTALAYAAVVRGGTIRGPGPDGSPDGGDITRADILRRDVHHRLRPDPTAFFRRYTPMRQDLMPTFDFLTTPGAHTPISVNRRPSDRSGISLDLNGASTPGHVPWAAKVTARGGSVTVTFAPGARQATQGVLYDFRHPGAVNANAFVDTPIGVAQTDNRHATYLPLPALLFPRPQDHSRSVGGAPYFRLGDSEQAGPLQGDNQVPFVSGIADYESPDSSVVDPNVAIVLWGNGSPQGIDLPHGAAERWTMQSGYPIMHDYFFSNPDVDAFVVAKLGGSPGRG